MRPQPDHFRELGIAAACADLIDKATGGPGGRVETMREIITKGRRRG